MKDKTLENIILHKFPYPIAVRYQQLLAAESFEIKARRCVEIYEAGLRALTLGILGQYLQRDSEAVNDATLNKVALQLIDINRPPSLGTWKNVFFTALKAYQGHRDRFFMTELYDFYWDTGVTPHRPRKGVQQPFQKLIELRNAISHTSPTDPAAWRSLYTEIDGYLHDILRQFLFLANYDLIHIVEQVEDGYVYDIYTGQQVQRAGFTPTKKSLKEGWCYLSKTTGDLLPVHPLIIFWEDELNQGKIHTTPEVVVYDSYKVQQIKYWHSSAGALETRNPDLLDLFIALIVERLEAQRPQREIYRLNWGELKVLSGQIALQRMGDARGKYDPRLYLQRQKTREAFDEFLKSDKSCLILTGSSGVGKSNFLISLIDEFQESGKVCILAYNGARLDANLPLEDILAQDFNHHLKLREQDQPDGPGVLKLINALESSQEQQIILFLDAINENPDGKALLRQINRLVESFPYPWLKVVISSRPEAWRSIKRGVPLAEHRYFRQQGKDELGVEIAGFSYADYEVRVEPFAFEELPEVYEKYRQVYDLVTRYDDVPTNIKKLLRDPLTLLLVAEIYRGHDIPAELRSGELIEQYVQRLVATERLNKTDLYFLKQEIVPRLFTPPFKPTLSSSDIENELTTDGRPLFELIFNNDPLPGGRRVNQSYMNLADCAILVEQDAVSDQAVGFKYERFYELFGGEYQSLAAHKSGDPIGLYESFNSQLETRPYLWGALKNALFSEYKQDNFAIVVHLAALASATNRLLRNAIISSLVEFSELELDKVSAFLGDLITPCYGPAQTIGETLRRFLRRKKFDAELLRPSQSIAIEVAGRLGLEEILFRAASDRLGALRQAAALHTFYVWRNNREAGYRIMRKLGDQAIAAWGLPDLGTLDSLINLVVSTIVYDYQNQAVQQNALDIGRHVLRELLLLNPEERPTLVGQVRRLIAKQIRRPLINLALEWGIRVLRGWSDNDIPANYDTLSHFFTLPYESRQVLAPVIPHLDPYCPDLAGRVNDIIACQNTGDFFILAAAETAPIIRSVVNPDDAREALRGLVELSLNSIPPGPNVLGVAWVALQMAAREREPNPELLSLGIRCIQEIQRDPRDWLKRHHEFQAVPNSGDTIASGLGIYIMFMEHYENLLDSSLLETWLERALKANDIEYLQSYVREQLTLVFEMGYYRSALQGLKLVSNVKDAVVQQAVTELLILIHRYYPEEVEDLLLQEVFSKEVNRQVWASSATERINDLFGIKAAGVFYDVFLLGPEILRAETLWLGEQSLKMPSLKAMVALLLKEIINLAAGEAVFPIPDGSPTKVFLRNHAKASMGLPFE